jgi:transcriptional regulator with XRE-family HTH domain
MKKEISESVLEASSDSQFRFSVPIRESHDVDWGEPQIIRMTAVVEALVTRKRAAEVAGVSPDMLAKYLDGSSRPRFDVVARLAAAGRFSLDWLATGEGPMHPTAGPAPHLAALAGGQTQYQGPLDGVREDARPGPPMTKHPVNTGDSGVKLAVALAVEALGDPSQALRPERLADLIDAAHQLLQAGADPELVRRLIAAAAQP